MLVKHMSQGLFESEERYPVSSLAAYRTRRVPHDPDPLHTSSELQRYRARAAKMDCVSLRPATCVGEVDSVNMELDGGVA